MNVTLVIVMALLSAVFAVVYLPVLARLSSGLVSSYPKADSKRRFGAAMTDGLLCTTCVLLYASSKSIPFLFLGGAYILLRDGAIPGQSLGKLLFGLTVIQLDGGQACTLWRSVQRNIFFVIPGLNLVAVVLEAHTCRRDPQGQRLGDKLAQTQVVLGKDAKELVKALQQRLLSDVADVERMRDGRGKRVEDKV